jgi:hypothetical protein
VTGTLPIPAIGSPNSTEDQDIHDALNTLNGLLTSSNKLDGAQIGASTIPAATAHDIGPLDTGVYFPSTSIVSNLDSTPDPRGSGWHYIRLGEGVFMWGGIDVDPTATGNAEFTAPLPIASTFVSGSHMGGTAICVDTGVFQVGSIASSITDDLIHFQFEITSTSQRTWTFTLGYVIQ